MTLRVTGKAIGNRIFGSGLDSVVSSDFGWFSPGVPRILTVKDSLPTLKTRSEGRIVTQADAKRLFDLLMAAVMSSKKQVGSEGIGLSAVQIGVLARGFIAYINDKWELFIDPKINILDKRLVYMPEGCLSIPGTEVVVGRPKKIEVVYLDAELDRHRLILKGYAARVILHEFDHLEGILITDRGVS